MKLKESINSLFRRAKNAKAEQELQKLREQSIRQENIESKKRLIDEIRREAKKENQPEKEGNKNVILNLIQDLKRFRIKSGMTHRFHTLKLKLKLHKLQRNYQKLTKDPAGASKFFSKINYYFQYAVIIVKDIVSLLVHPTSYHFFRVQTCGANPEDPIRKKKFKITFSSYSALKRFRRRLKIFTFSGAGVVSIALIVTLMSQLLFVKISQGSTYTFVQSDWSGGATTNNAVHPTNETGWTQYSAKDANLTAGTTLSLTPVNASTTQTSDTDFNAGTLSSVSVSGTGSAANLTLTQNGAANSWTTMASAPFAVGNGSYDADPSLVYDGNGNFYTIQSNKTYGFWKYSIATNTWTAMANAPVASSYSTPVAYDGNGNIYAIFVDANNITSFYEYSISANTWTKLQVPPASVANSGYGTSLVSDNNGNIFAFQGDSTAFWKYNIASNTWSTMANAPAQVYGGAALVYGNNGNIYGFRGWGFNTFWKYNVASNAWSTMANSPIGINSGADLAYDDNGNIYAFPGGNYSQLYFWKYSIASNTWTAVANTPSEIFNGGALAYDGNGNMYAFKGFGTTAFWKYSINDSYANSGTFESATMDLGVGSNLSALNFTANQPSGTSVKFQLATADASTGPFNYVGPDGTANTYFTSSGQATPAALNGHRYLRYKTWLAGNGGNWLTMSNMLGTSSEGGLVYDENGNIYDINNSTSSNFIKYSISSNTWAAMANPPSTISYGSALAYDGNNNFYAFLGNNTGNFAKYSIASNAWTTLASAPSAIGYGGALAYDGNGNVYGFPGGSAAFWKYNIASNTWTAMANSPAAVSSGGSLTYDGNNNFYAFLGNNTGNFAKYSIASNAWTILANAPSSVCSGGSLAYDNQNIYGFQGWCSYKNYQNMGFWEYNVASNTWTTLIYSPAAVSSGGSLTYDDNGNIYGITGHGSSGFWKYSIFSNLSPSLSDVTINYTNYPTSQTLTSSPYNSTDPGDVLAKIQWTATTPTNTGVKFQVRTAPDNGSGAPGTWSGWVGPDGTSSTYFTDPTGAQAMPTSTKTNSQWLQYQATLTSDGFSGTPTVSNVTMTYVVNAPPSVSGVTASESSTGQVTVNYSVSDSDTSTDANPGYVNVNLQYCTANCGTPGSETWATAKTITADNTSTETIDSTTGTISNVATSGAHVITWTPKTDYNGQYNSGFKIRIEANDGEIANNLAYGDSSSFILDTKNPGNIAFTLDHSVAQNSIQINFTSTPADDSSYTMAVADDLVDLPDSSKPSAFIPYASPYTYATSKVDPATIYVRIMDAYGNYTDTHVTTPGIPNNLSYYDTSDVTNSVYQEMLVWSTVPSTQWGTGGFKQYNIWRSTDGTNFGTSPIKTITDSTLNYYMDKGLASGTKYYYKVTAEDQDGDVSYFSNTINDTPDGNGSSDTTPPVISSIHITNITQTTATVSWSTDEPSDSTVGYNVYVPSETSTETYLPETGNATMTESHSVTISGLTPDTNYAAQIKSRDLYGNLQTNDDENVGGPASSPNQESDFRFTTEQGPLISNVQVSSVNNNQATIKWQTDKNSDSHVYYSDTISNGDLLKPTTAGTTDMVGGSYPYEHSVTVTGLTEGTSYYFYVASKDSSGNTAALYNDPSSSDNQRFFSFVTGQDNNAPVISGIEALSVNSNEATIHWVTDKQATTKVEYGTSKGGPYEYTYEIASSYDVNHYAVLASAANANQLDAGTKYYYEVMSTDINGNTSKSSEQNFTTEKEAAYQHDPLSKITNISNPPTLLTATNAVVSFNTDQPALCLAEVTTSQGSYANPLIFEEDGYTAKTNYNYSHSINFTGLIMATKYYYTLSCEDNLNTVVSSDEQNFTTETQSELLSQEGLGALGETHAPPAITNVKTSNVTGEGITVTWDTDENANSLVKYGITSGNYTSVAGDGTDINDTTKFNTTHSVVMGSLIPGTKYYYRVVSYDTYGNISESAESTFTTSAPSSISSIKVVSTALNQATITWNTSVKTNTIVEYGLTTSYGETKTDTAMATTHSIDLSSLNSGQTYHFRVKGEDGNKNLYASADYTFQPKSPPKISNVTVGNVTEHGVAIKFNTDVPTDSLATYTDIKNAKDIGSQGKPDLTTTHEIDLQGLNPGTTFSLTLKVRDQDGNETTQAAQNFTTGIDKTPPKIDQVRTDSALTQDNAVQTIISWITDEPADTSLIYREGINGEKKEVKVDSNFSTTHTVVITSFKPGTVYYFNAKSSDPSGNVATSQDFALLTPKKQQNIIQIIVSNFQGIFSWMNLGGTGGQ